MYSLVFNGRELSLPNYTFKIAEKLEALEASNNSQKKFKEKCKSMYSFEKELLGDDEIKELIGEFEECDPNDISLLYRGIIDCYNSPIIQQRNEQISQLLDNSDLSKITNLVNTINSIERLDKKYK